MKNVAAKNNPIFVVTSDPCVCKKRLVHGKSNSKNQGIKPLRMSPNSTFRPLNYHLSYCSV